MDDLLLTLVFALFLITVVLAVLVLPIVSLIISSRTRTRISELHARIDRIEKTLAAHTIFPSAPKPEPEARPEPEPEPVTPPPPTVTPETPTSSRAPALSAYQLESMIGRRWVGWAAVSLILFATAFFLKYAFDNRWIGELGRVAIGIAFGIG